MNEFGNADIEKANQWAGYGSLIPNFISWALRRCSYKTIGIFSGNRPGKTHNVATDYVDRILGKHPIEWKNIRPNTPIRILRFASETLPVESEGEEVGNTQYPALKMRLPSYLIKKDITVRKPVMTIKDIQGGPDIYIEFVSFNQELQRQAGVDRFSVWIDEHAPKSFYDEQLPRLLSARQSGRGGDLIISLTPVDYISWEFEEISERADVVYNSPNIINYLKNTYGKIQKIEEKTGYNTGVAIIRASTDDNPIYTKETIDEMMAQYTDREIYEIRRYGIFHQISGRILKDYDPFVHMISRDKYFPQGLPYEWIHGRGIDFHEQTSWACGWLALSPENEAFIYNEFNPSPDRMVTLEIARRIAEISGDYKYHTNVVDPRMAIKQNNTGITPLDDLNRAFREFQRDRVCSGGFWKTWDTKNLRGRDIIKERLKNSRYVGRPFSNKMSKDMGYSYLPTLWVLNNCPTTNYMFKNWKWEDWSNREANLVKDEKNKEEDKNSHFPKTYECLFKESIFNTYKFQGRVLPERKSGYESMMRLRA